MRKRAGSVLLAAGMTALMALAVLSAAVRGPWTTEPRDFEFPFEPGPVPTLVAPEEEEQGPEVAADQSGLDALDVTWMAVVAGMILLTVLILLLLRLIRRLRRPIGGAQAPRGLPSDIDAPPEPDIPVLLRGVSAARELLTRFAEPSDAVVAAWLALEEAADRSGVHRRPSSTPTEFTMAVLAATPAPPAATRELLDLYRTARFSTHPITATDLDRAAGCLAEIAESFTAAAGAERAEARG
ncbi:DUF4129 domain-containing protein [Lysobacter korlensis]|uniref:DUF4129 domain-containing protein n=1 Tax=Lysobacter korlensis TaxID=553636 RepID=A0ABV6RXV9_9GAMM